MILNKIDLVSEAELERVEARLRNINAFAPIQRSTQSQVSVDSVLGIRGFDLKRTLEMDPEFLNTEGEHEHDSSVTSLSITTPGDVHMALVNQWIDNLLRTKGTDIYRMKGILAIATASKKYVYQGVHMIFDGKFEDEVWADGEPRQNKLVFIGKNLNHDELKAGFDACLDNPENQEKIRAINQAKEADQKNKALLSAAQRDDCAALKALTSDGVDPSWRNPVGQTALHIAVMWGNFKACEFLCGVGADPNARNDPMMGQGTPLHCLAQSSRGSVFGRLQCAQKLVETGADIRATNDEGMAPYQMLGDGDELAEIRKILTPSD
jgi:hypothetical protein